MVSPDDGAVGRPAVGARPSRLVPLPCIARTKRRWATVPPGNGSVRSRTQRPRHRPAPLAAGRGGRPDLSADQSQRTTGRRPTTSYRPSTPEQQRAPAAVAQPPPLAQRLRTPRATSSASSSSSPETISARGAPVAASAPPRAAAAGASGSPPPRRPPAAPARAGSRARRVASATPLSRALAIVASTARRSESNAATGPKPSRAAAIDSTPEPQPRSQSEPRAPSSAAPAAAPGTAAWWDARRCRTRAPGRSPGRSRPGAAAACSHGGRTQIRPPISTGEWNRFQRSSQSSGTSVPLTTTRTPPTSASPSASSGSSPGAP